MHDWTLISLLYDWANAKLTISFRNSASNLVSLLAVGVADLNVPQHKDWGPSVSVNKIVGPTKVDAELEELLIEMQSGDTIRIVAKLFDIPK